MSDHQICYSEDVISFHQSPDAHIITTTAFTSFHTIFWSSSFGPQNQQSGGFFLSGHVIAFFPAFFRYLFHNNVEELNMLRANHQTHLRYGSRLALPGGIHHFSVAEDIFRRKKSFSHSVRLRELLSKYTTFISGWSRTG